MASQPMQDTHAPQIMEHFNKSLTYTPFDCKWIPCSGRFVVMGQYARGTGVLQIYELQAGEVKMTAEVGSSLPFFIESS